MIEIRSLFYEKQIPVPMTMKPPVCRCHRGGVSTTTRSSFRIAASRPTISFLIG
jgi:hypothetical protein